MRSTGFAEGSPVLEAHYRRERSPELRSNFITARRAEGPLACEICSLAAIPQHAALSEGRFEVHHIVPLGSGERRETTLADLALLCANCHRLIHRAMQMEQRWLSIAEARNYLRQRALA
ncbi:HNH endonuclease [Pseudogemmatithrix spongiicola]|uniref:HNH endonuclease n=1 Tax=Pseudogemmatithrix spongiicola TaxID=3062599 RepID=UPI003466F8FF